MPFGIVGGRLYHVITDPEPYFGAGGDPIRALYIWKGGLGIWGAIALGGVGAWIGCRRHGILLPPFADALAPGHRSSRRRSAAGATGSTRSSTAGRRRCRGACEIDPDATGAGADGSRSCGYFQPTFLYESLWDLGVAALVIWADRRFRLGHGRVFALYVSPTRAAGAGSSTLRIDPGQPLPRPAAQPLDQPARRHRRAGLPRALVAGSRPGREESVFRDHHDVDEDDAASPAMTRWMTWVRSRPNRRGDDDAEDDTEDDTESRTGNGTEDPTGDRSEKVTPGPGRRRRRRRAGGRAGG